MAISLYTSVSRIKRLEPVLTHLSKLRVVLGPFLAIINSGSSNVCMQYLTTKDSKPGTQTAKLSVGCVNAPWSEALMFDLISQTFALSYPGTLCYSQTCEALEHAFNLP